MSQSIMSVSGLHLTVDSDPIGFEPVSGASLQAERGKVLGIVGESGSGKSLTLRAIAGLLPSGVRVSRGEIRVAGIDVNSASRKELRRLHGAVIGMIFQEPTTALNPTMRVGAQIAEAVRAHSDLSRSQAMGRAIDLLEQMAFAEPERRHRLYPHELSGGMRQRVMIAMALAASPALLLCDEPTTALDATVTMRVLDLLVDLAGRLDIGVVLVTHDLGAAARVCDRIVVMYAGSVLEEGPALDVLSRPRHPYTLALLRAVPTRDTTITDLQAISGSAPVAGEELPGCPFAPRCAYAENACLSRIQLHAVGRDRVSGCRRHTLLEEMSESKHK